MYNATSEYNESIKAAARLVRAKLSVGVEAYADDGELKSISIDRGSSNEKVIGNAISAKITAEIANPDLVPATGVTMQAKFWTDEMLEASAVSTPPFILESVDADEDQVCYTLTGHDAMILLDGYTASEISVTYPSTIGAYAAQAATCAGLELSDTNWLNASVQLNSPPNLDGSENCRAVIAWAAECAFGNAYIDRSGKISIRSIIPDATAYDINPDQYFECNLKSAYGPINTLTLARLPQNDNVYREDASAVAANGRIDLQISDNPFLDEIRDSVIDTMFAQISGTIVQPYSLDWRGNPAFDPGDTITLTDTNNAVRTAIYGAETLDFDGGMRSSVEFNAPSNTTVNYSKATNTREVLRRTILQVDKANQRIDFEASRTDGIESNVAAISMTTDQISQSVQSVQEDNGALKTRVGALETTAEGVSVKVQDIIDNGVSKVVTETGYEFGADGLHISKSGEEMENQIDHTGVYVKRNDEVVLQANNNGVEAENVTVRTYLTVGLNSRFEDYGSDRTGCFYVGGGS